MIDKVNSEEKDLLVKRVDRLSLENFILQESVVLSKQGSCSLNPQMQLYTEYGDSLCFSDVKKRKMTLVLRYSIHSCSTCVADLIDLIRSFTQENSNIEVLILTTFQTKDEVKSIYRINGNLINIYSAYSIKLPLEKELIPYFFLLDEDLRVLDTYIPHKELPHLTKRYLERIKEICNKSERVSIN